MSHDPFRAERGCLHETLPVAGSSSVYWVACRVCDVSYAQYGWERETWPPKYPDTYTSRIVPLRSDSDGCAIPGEQVAATKRAA